MDRGNHYEAAFEDYLRDRALPYIGVDETRRSLLGDGPVKSLDFIVYGIKGCLRRWAEIFGPGYEAAFVFMYKLGEKVSVAEDTPDLWTWRGDRYLLRGVLVEDYAENMRSRSPKWGTVGLTKAAFQKIVRPLWEFTHLREFVAHHRSVQAITK
ncbi:MAG: HYExAFE family protein [Gemmataceae bacterium]